MRYRTNLMIGGFPQSFEIYGAEIATLSMFPQFE